MYYILGMQGNDRQERSAWLELAIQRIETREVESINNELEHLRISEPK